MPISASIRSRGVRTGTAVAAAVAAAGLILAGAPAAFAAPGDSGDLSVQSIGQQRGNNREGAPVCAFKLVAANFETLPVVPFTIIAQPPTVPPGDTLIGSLALNQGKAVSQEYLLPDGTYQLQWTVPVGLKQKTFTIDCSRNGNSQGRPGNQGGEGHKEGSSWSGEDKDHHRPSGAVPAGGGGVPAMENVSSDNGSAFGATTALAAGAAGVTGLILVRRAARRRASGAA
ncbi:hypothetical protein OG413_35825 [Streptomyces sp. NBC_01433]|uniref:hypothetical protein n=1 Tax=Streptomyces sp. NBC_01433 TaxID=2903864 RepID=UPI002255B70C|nr:hypothetical protein [Streptomyces sp. NBC_01433]MCX4680583.1 hypothetical protein [Streptomyces sp. NBC_01433]